MALGDALQRAFMIINFVLGQFAEPFLQVFRYTHGMLLDNPLPVKKGAETVAQAMIVFLHIFYDLVCQDLPQPLRILILRCGKRHVHPLPLMGPSGTANRPGRADSKCSFTNKDGHI